MYGRILIFFHSGHEFYVIVNFQPEFGGTRVVFKMIFDSAAECEKIRGFITDANEQNFNRLERELGALVSAV